VLGIYGLGPGRRCEGHRNWLISVDCRVLSVRSRCWIDALGCAPCDRWKGRWSIISTRKLAARYSLQSAVKRLPGRGYLRLSQQNSRDLGGAPWDKSKNPSHSGAGTKRVCRFAGVPWAAIELCAGLLELKVEQGKKALFWTRWCGLGRWSVAFDGADRRRS